MISIAETVQIDAPVRTVFEYMDDPRNHVEVTPSLSEVSDIEPLENGGKRVSHTYRMAGVGLEGELVQTTHKEDALMTFEMHGALEGEIRLRFRELGEDRTELTYEADYELPETVLASVTAPFVRIYNERELRTTLENVKSRLELDAQG